MKLYIGVPRTCPIPIPRSRTSGWNRLLRLDSGFHPRAMASGGSAVKASFPVINWNL
jgi:hypothetical protein